jgi:hypothetical protein
LSGFDAQQAMDHFEAESHLKALTIFARVNQIVGLPLEK